MGGWARVGRPILEWGPQATVLTPLGFSGRRLETSEQVCRSVVEATAYRTTSGSRSSGAGVACPTRPQRCRGDRQSSLVLDATDRGMILDLPDVRPPRPGALDADAARRDSGTKLSATTPKLDRR